MTTTAVTMTVAGLSALVVKQGATRAAAALVAHPHRHVPLLLVTDGAVGSEDPFASTRRVDPKEYLVRSRIKPAGFRAYLVDGIDIAVSGTAGNPGLSLHRQDISGLECPPSSDWSPLDWLLDLSAAHRKSFKFKKGLKEGNMVRCVFGMDNGMLKGHAPVEVGAVRKFTYKNTPKRAYTDAFQWEQTYSSTPSIVLTPRGGEPAAITLKADATCALLNLPLHIATPGEHVKAFNGLPFDAPQGIEAARDTTESCRGVAPHDDATAGGETEHHDERGRGDSFCMAAMLEADQL
jgi:hypothetical protein